MQQSIACFHIGTMKSVYQHIYISIILYVIHLHYLKPSTQRLLCAPCNARRVAAAQGNISNEVAHVPKRKAKRHLKHVVEAFSSLRCQTIENLWLSSKESCSEESIANVQERNSIHLQDPNLFEDFLRKLNSHLSVGLGRRCALDGCKSELLCFD